VVPKIQTLRCQRSARDSHGFGIPKSPRLAHFEARVEVRASFQTSALFWRSSNEGAADRPVKIRSQWRHNDRPDHSTRKNSVRAQCVLSIWHDVVRCVVTSSFYKFPTPYLSRGDPYFSCFGATRLLHLSLSAAQHNVHALSHPRDHSEASLHCSLSQTEHGTLCVEKIDRMPTTHRKSRFSRKRTRLRI
jgi:hypothetical protein